VPGAIASILDGSPDQSICSGLQAVMHDITVLLAMVRRQSEVNIC